MRNIRLLCCCSLLFALVVLALPPPAPAQFGVAITIAPPALPVTDLAEALASALRAQPPAGMRLEQRLRMRPPLSFWALVHCAW